MNDKNRVKAGALNKLKNYVECEIRRLRDGGLSLEHFEYSPTSDYYTEEEAFEISSIAKRLKYLKGIEEYCNINDIKI